ncbi:MAG: NYN domain-containing protein [Propionibacteriaceae bacterium]|nr:NYN domain-containing protein [Propionibacteriaceae bacterium]
MAGMRVRDLAREFGVTDWDVLERLHDMGERAGYSSVFLNPHIVRRLRAEDWQSPGGWGRKDEWLDLNPHRADGHEDGKGIAVFIDLENLTGGFGYTASYCSVDFEETFALLAETGPLVNRVAYATIPVRSAVGSVVKDLRRLDVSLIDVINPRSKDSSHSGKNGVDFQIYADAVAMAATREDIGTIVIMSGDNDFYALAGKVKALGKRAVVAIKEDFRLTPAYTELVDEVVTCRSVESNGTTLATSDLYGPAWDLMAALSSCEPTVTRFTPETRVDYLSEVARWFDGALGDVITSRGFFGVTVTEIGAAIAHLVPGGVPKALGFSHWLTVVRVALPQAFEIVTGSTPEYDRVVHGSFLHDRKTVRRLTIEALGEAPEIHQIIGFAAPLGTLPPVVEWCAGRTDMFTAEDCVRSLRDATPDGDIVFADVKRCLMALVTLGYLREMRGRPAEGTGPAANKGASKSFQAVDVMDDVAVLQAIIDTIQARTQAATWPVGPTFQAGVDAMRARVLDLRAGRDHAVVGAATQSTAGPLGVPGQERVDGRFGARLLEMIRVIRARLARAARRLTGVPDPSRSGTRSPGPGCV